MDGGQEDDGQPVDWQRAWQLLCRSHVEKSAEEVLVKTGSWNAGQQVAASPDSSCAASLPLLLMISDAGPDYHELYALDSVVCLLWPSGPDLGFRHADQQGFFLPGARGCLGVGVGLGWVTFYEAPGSVFSLQGLDSARDWKKMRILHCDVLELEQPVVMHLDDWENDGVDDRQTAGAVWLVARLNCVLMN